VVTPAADTLGSLGETVQLNATAQDANGDSVSGQTFTWTSSNEGVTTVSSTGLVTAVGNGAATITAAAQGIPGTAMLTVMQTATQLAFSVQPSDGVAGAALSPAVEVEIQDANGMVVATATDPVTLAIANNPVGGALAGTVTVNAVNGIASFSGLSIDKAGAGYTLIATSGTLTSATSASFTAVWPGSFQATLSGDLSLNVSGGAVFGIQTQQGSSAFAIALLSGVLGQDGSDIIFIGRDNPTAPGVGIYPIHSASCVTCTADDFAGAYLRQVTARDLGFFASDTGAFTIGAASADTLRGTFDFTTSAFLVFGSVTADSVRLQGSFTAVAGRVPTTP
jgi:hypothetical protein